MITESNGAVTYSCDVTGCSSVAVGEHEARAAGWLLGSVHRCLQCVEGRRLPDRTTLAIVEPSHLEAPPVDAVNHPPHYTFGGLEVIDAIEAWKLDFHRGNAVKYLARAGRKDPRRELEDLRKANWYVERAIELLLAEQAGGAKR